MGEGVMVCVGEEGVGKSKGVCGGREGSKGRGDEMEGGVGGCVCVWRRGRKEGGEGGEVV